MTDGALLSVSDLRVEFGTERGTVYAVNGISFEVSNGETLGIVGESGCGKSVTSLALLGLLARTGRVTSGEALFDGRDLLQMSDGDLRKIRGKDVAMIFQDPMSSLNPVHRVGAQIREALTTHFDLSAKEADARVIELLDQVGIPSAKSRAFDYPHQFSGGMRQRAMIAMALACEPKLLIADEPTTALDVTIQAQILDLLRTLVTDRGTALILITHDLGVVAGMCERVQVMYSGNARRDRHGRSDLRPTPPSLHARPPAEHAAAGRRTIVRPPADRGTAAQHAEPAVRLSVRAPLSLPPRYLLGAAPSTGVARRWPAGGLLQPGRSGRVEAQSSRRANRVTAGMGSTLVELDDVRVWFPIKSGLVLDRHVGDVKAVDGVSLTIERGETLGLVGESGCGKSTLGRAILRLYEPTVGTDRLRRTATSPALSEAEMRAVRRRMQMIFQDPYASLNPRHSVGRIVGEPLRVHGVASRSRGRRESPRAPRGRRPTGRRRFALPARVLRRPAPADRPRARRSR